MTPAQSLVEAHARCPLVAILRGLDPREADEVSDVLVDQGFAMLEVPLNSPDPLRSIERIAERHGERVLVGAGTVLSPAEVDEVARAGGRLIVAPNTDERVIARSVERSLVCLPGCFTPTEAFAALRWGAHGLKFFPAEAGGPATLRAMRAVLPPGAPVLAVGGVTPDNLGEWIGAGAAGAGLGSGLYKPGMLPPEIAARARAYLAALPACLRPEDRPRT